MVIMTRKIENKSKIANATFDSMPKAIISFCKLFISITSLSMADVFGFLAPLKNGIYNIL